MLTVINQSLFIRGMGANFNPHQKTYRRAPNLGNLISYRKIDDRGLKVSFKYKYWTLVLHPIVCTLSNRAPKLGIVSIHNFAITTVG